MHASNIGFLGFGEAAQAFAAGWRDAGHIGAIHAYDILFDEPSRSTAIVSACKTLNVHVEANPADLKTNSDVIISAVTADQATNAARSIGALEPTQLYLDINSVAPEKKRAAARTVGDGYLDVAVLSPVHPKRHASPLLIGGPAAEREAERLLTLFPAAEIFSGAVGEASTVKMIRSVFVKGIEAVAAECALAAYKTGLAERIFPSLDLVIAHETTQALADYTMERVAVHGVRRGAEMQEVRATLDDLGLPSPMSSAAEQMQNLIGAMNINAATGITLDARGIAAEVIERLGNARGS